MDVDGIEFCVKIMNDGCSLMRSVDRVGTSWKLLPQLIKRASGGVQALGPETVVSTRSRPWQSRLIPLPCGSSSDGLGVLIHQWCQIPLSVAIMLHEALFIVVRIFRRLGCIVRSQVDQKPTTSTCSRDGFPTQTSDYGRYRPLYHAPPVRRILQHLAVHLQESIFGGLQSQHPSSEIARGQDRWPWRQRSKREA